MVVGMAGFNAFTRRVFRPEETWARILEWGLPGVMLFGMGLTLVTQGYRTSLVTVGAGDLLQQFGAMATLSWAAWESERYAGMLKRRLALGLADPVVFDRVRLWGFAMSLAVVLCASAIGAHLLGINLISIAPGAAFVGFVAGSALYLAFFPPRAYTSWVIARNGARESR